MNPTNPVGTVRGSSALVGDDRRCTAHTAHGSRCQHPARFTYQPMQAAPSAWLCGVHARALRPTRHLHPITKSNQTGEHHD